MNDLRVQVLFKRSRHKIISVFKKSQDDLRLPERTIRVNIDIFYTFQPNTIKGPQQLFPGEASMASTTDDRKICNPAVGSQTIKQFSLTWLKNSRNVPIRPKQFLLEKLSGFQGLIKT